MAELLAELFSSKVRAAVLTLMLPRPHLAFSLTELSRRLGLPVSSLQHECYKLARLGLLRDARMGSARRYRPNPGFPLLEPLTALTLRAISLPEALHGAVEAVSGVEHAWLVGDLDVVSEPLYLAVVGRLDLEALDGLFDRARAALGPAHAGRLELAYFLPPDWEARCSVGDPFLAGLRESEAMDMLDGAGRAATSRPGAS